MSNANMANLIASDHTNNNGTDIRPSMNSYITPMMSSAPSSQQRDDGTHIWHHDGQKNIYATAYPVDFYGRVTGPATGQPHIAGIASVPNSGSASGNIMGVYTPNGLEINHAAAADYGAASAAAGYQQFYPYSYAPHQATMYPADMYQNPMPYATVPPSSQHQQIAVAYNAAGTMVAIPSKNNPPVTVGGGNGAAAAAVVTNFGRNSTNTSQTIVQNQQQNSTVTHHQPSANAVVASGGSNNYVAFGNHQQSHPNFYMNAYATAAAVASGNIVTASGGDSVQTHHTSSKFSNNMNNVKCNNNGSSSAKGAASKLSIYENCSENYTERWVSSTVSVPPDMRLSPDNNDHQHHPVLNNSPSVVVEGNGGFVPKQQPLQTLSITNGWPSSQQDHRGNSQNIDEMATSSAFTSANSGGNNDHNGGVDQQRHRFVNIGSVGKNLNLSQKQSGSAGFRGGTSNVGNGRNSNGPVQRRGNGDSALDAFGQNSRNLQSSNKNMLYSRDYPQTMGGGGAIGVVGASNPVGGLNECSSGGGSTVVSAALITSSTDYDGSKVVGGTSAATSSTAGGGATTWADMVKKSGNCSAGETRLCAPPTSNGTSTSGVGISPTRHGGTLDGTGNEDNTVFAACPNSNTLASVAIGSGRQTRYGNNVSSRGGIDRNKGKLSNRNYSAGFNNTTINGGKNFSSSAIVSGSRMSSNFRSNNQSSNYNSNCGSNEHNSGNQRFGGGNNNGSFVNPAKNNNGGGGNQSQQKFAVNSAAKAAENDQMQVKADVSVKQRGSNKMYNSGSCGGATNQSGVLLLHGMNQQIHGINQQQYSGNGTTISVIQPPPVQTFSMFNNSMPPPFMSAIPVTSQSFSMSNNGGLKWNIVSTSTGDSTSQQGAIQYRNASAVGAVSGGAHFQQAPQNVHHSVVVSTSGSGDNTSGHPHQIQQSQPSSFLIPFPQGSSGVPPPFYGILAGGPPPQLLTATGGTPFSVPFQTLPPPLAAAMPPQMMQPFVLCAPPPLSPQEERFRNTWLDQDAVPLEQLNNERTLCNYVVAHNNAVVMARDARAKDPNAQTYCGTLLATTVQLINNNKANHNCRVDPRGVALFLSEQHAGAPHHNQHYGQLHPRFGGSGRRNNQSHRLSTGVGGGGDRSLGDSSSTAVPRSGGVVRSRSVGAGGGSSDSFPHKQRYYSKKVGGGKAYSPDVLVVGDVDSDLKMTAVDSVIVKKENESEFLRRKDQDGGKVDNEQTILEDGHPTLVESSIAGNENTIVAMTIATEKFVAVAITNGDINDKSNEENDDTTTEELKPSNNVSAADEMKDDKENI